MPVTQGSKSYIGHGRMMEVNGERLKAWRGDVKRATYDAIKQQKDVDWNLEGAFSISLIFRFPRPKAHYGAKGLKGNAPQHMTTRKGDLDKLCRSVFDALTTTAYFDDAQVVTLNATRRYAAGNELPGVSILLVRLRD